MIFPTSDPVADFERYDAERIRIDAELPQCDECGEQITDDTFYIFDGEKICENCLAEHRRRTDDYLCQ